MRHLSDDAGAGSQVDCDVDPFGSLVKMFVMMVQQGRIAKGQCPALRPVFLKPHGVAHGTFRIRGDLPDDLKVGLFSGTEYPAWVRFSSDTLTTLNDFRTTVGIGIKLFNAPTPKIFGDQHDQTFDFILQNFDVFFVDTARDMCAFTKAGVVDGNYDPYLAAHPVTARLLDEMAKPVASTLGIAYWSGVPFSFGAQRFVKYKLEPTIDAGPLTAPPADPTYLAADLHARLKAGETRFQFCVQCQTDPELMPLDKATVRWDEAVSPPIHVADLILPQQDIYSRGQAEYGENLSWNIWRVTEDHKPAGSIAEVRRVVYAASAEQRRNVNGVPTGEPSQPRPAINPAPCVDTRIVRAAIHPAIGIARIGDSATDYFVGPEVVDPAFEKPEFYRDAKGALKRQAARFRIYGFNANDEVVRELTPDNANITWTVHLANRKAQWYQFQAALDIPEAASMSVPLRNAAFKARDQLAIDPGPRSIAGASVSGGAEQRFDTGKFKGTVVPLGEIRTDAAGHLLVLGGTGKSASPSGAPVYDPARPDSFNNANDWYDDTSDGPVTATVAIGGQTIPVEAAWVVVAPPNYAPNVVSWRTLHDLLVDIYVQSGWLAMPPKLSFTNDVLPILRRLSNLQWVNQGFATMYGKGCPMDFDNHDFIAKLATRPDPRTRSDPYAELRQVIYNSFRPPQPSVSEPVTWPHVWPWIYGDAFGSFPANGPGNMLTMTPLQASILARWVAGDVEVDWPPASPPPDSLDRVPLAEQPDMLDKSALHFCLADTFHPGCEMTWPMRHTSLYSKPFRIRHRPADAPEPNYGATLNPQIARALDGPLHAQGPGDITRWMALPWQGDTAFCRSGYDPQFDPYLPTFWAARVPNQVLTDEDYQTAIDTSLPRETRIAAFHRRAPWLRAVDGPVVADVMMRMIAQFGALGIIEARPGVKGDPEFPETMFVESLVASHLKEAAMRMAVLRAELPRPLTRIERAGWSSEEQFHEFRRVRVRGE
jgi:hypothetical protein